MEHEKTECRCGDDLKREESCNRLCLLKVVALLLRIGVLRTRCGNIRRDDSEPFCQILY